MELRNFAQEVRATGSDKDRHLSGYAATFNTLSNPIANSKGSFREKILPGAFDEVVHSPSVVMTLNHDNKLVLGRTGSRTLKLNVDSKGLRFDVALPNTSYGRDAYESVKRGDLNGCSFAFAGVEDSWAQEDEPEYQLGPGVRGRLRYANGEVKRFLVRTIKKFRNLIDVSVVTHAAYPGTEINARNLVAAEVRSRTERFERWLNGTPEQKLDVFCEVRKLNRADYRTDAKGDFIYVGWDPAEGIRRRRMLLNSVLV